MVVCEGLGGGCCCGFPDLGDPGSADSGEIWRLCVRSERERERDLPSAGFIGRTMQSRRERDGDMFTSSKAFAETSGN